MMTRPHPPDAADRASPVYFPFTQGHRIWNFFVKDLETWVAPAMASRGPKANRAFSGRFDYA